MNFYDTLINTISDKNVFLGTHWDADGVTSGAIIYHMIKKHAKTVNTISKGLTFEITPSDMQNALNQELHDIDYVICTDIQPSDDLGNDKTIYIDHHPNEDPSKYAIALHDVNSQSCTLTIWNNFKERMLDPYNVFLTLVGFFGDGGKAEDIPLDLYYLAQEMMPDMMVYRESRWGGGYFEIQRYVSLMNVGKRAKWSGDLPLELCKSVTDYTPIVTGKHVIARKLNSYKSQLRRLYDMPLDIKENGEVQYAEIECENNVQGVLCARHVKDKPILIINNYNNQLIGSLRVPDCLDFDAGKYLEGFQDQFDGWLGGGHEKAGGFSIDVSHRQRFLTILKNM
ncbi:hypothetical protein K9M79_02250 [Candidatus Woesearchaeota archaeon]|nr:hypothetical protein [Candidatus Woesearchaeota archaeon]